MTEENRENRPKAEVFYEHGAWRVASIDSVLLNSVWGTFDAHGIEELLHTQKQHIPLMGDNWAYICDGRHWTGAAPDSVKMVREIVRWDSAHGCRLRIFILPEVAYQQALIDQFEYEITQSGGQLEVVYRVDMAAKMAHERGFVEDPAALLQLMASLQKPATSD